MTFFGIVNQGAEMRLKISVVMISLATSCLVAADSPPGLQCFDELAVPRYPPLARQARITGEVKAVIHVGDNGKFDVDVSRAKGRGVLEDAVERALLTAKTLPACQGTSLTITFLFELSKEVKPYDPGVVVLRSPTTIVVRAAKSPIDY